MKKYWRLISLSALLFITLLTLSACGTSIAKKDVLTEDMRSQRITWGVKADTRLFGLENIRTGKLEGFEIDLATAITKKILGPQGSENFSHILEVVENERQFL